MDDLTHRAKKILASNYLNGFTKPAPSLYPYQWNWDSGFIAMAYAHYDEKKAVKEMKSLFSGQWKNGMLPQIVFHVDSDLYFPGPEFWKTDEAEMSPTGIKTSGITMPPVHGFALKYIVDHTTMGSENINEIQFLWDKVFFLHQYLYTLRDPYQEGLPYIIHPWEPGTDNSPILDSVLEKINIDSLSLPDYHRKDLQSEDAIHHRPQKKDYDRYVYLVDLFRKLHYDDKEIFVNSPFLVQDPLFIGILSRSNKDLISLGKSLGRDTQQLEYWDNLTSKSMNEKLWDPRGIYNAYDLKSKETIDVYSNSGFIPLLAGIPDTHQAKIMSGYISSPSFSGTTNAPGYLCPTHAIDHPAHDPQRYWRGPVWLNLNWMLSEGLRGYGNGTLADRIIKDSLELVKENGFFEYFDPRKNNLSPAGCGTDHFSWTAAMVVLMSQENN
ncbi:MAG: trehalase family glycosidase [Aureibaculum sp.]